MQRTGAIILGLTAPLLIGGTAHAGNYTAVEVGTTGELLKNSALHQDRHYLKDDRALGQRIAAVLGDMDGLLARLHALPPELAGTEVMTRQVNDELGYLVELALAGNPELAVYRSEEAALAARTRQTGAMQDPNLSFMFMALPFPQLPVDDTMMTRFEVGINQKFESHGKRKLRRSIASLEEDLQEYSLQQRELDLVGQVGSLYMDMLSTQSRLRILDQNIELVTLLLELAETKYSVGVAPQGQVLSAQVDLTKLQEQSISLNSLFDKQRRSLLGLLGNPDEDVLADLAFEVRYPEPEVITVDGAELLVAALDERPDYQRLKLMEDQQGMMLELARRGYKPDYTLSASYGFRWGRRDFVSAGISFPLFTNKEERQDAKVQETWAMLDTTAQKREVVENSLETRIAVLLVDLQRLKDSIDIYSNALVPQARLALDSNINGFAADRIELDQLFLAQKMLLTYEQDLEQKHIEYLGALAELQTITAGQFDPLDYMNLVVSAQSDTVNSLAAGMPGDSMNGGDEQFQPPAEGGFIAQLELPAEDGEQHPPTVPDEPADDGEGSNADPSEDGFYRPFAPKGKTE